MSILSKNKKRTNHSGVLGPISNGFYVAISYSMLFVALMLTSEKEITVDGLTIPALILFFVVKATEYFTMKNKKTSMPQWTVVGFFILAVVTAIVMTIFY
ncbi:MAG TPA: hypothetical protein GX525_10480 [Bacilli bacterium]|nr:hypothetical protein [Bacilli bacterium]